MRDVVESPQRARRQDASARHEEGKKPRLHREAERLGLSPEALAGAAIADLLAGPDDEFRAAAERVLRENEELYPTLIEKAAALCFSLVRNHPFVDGNKRVGHAAMETFLALNAATLDASVDDQEHLMLDLAAGRIDRTQLTDRLRHHLKPVG